MVPMVRLEGISVSYKLHISSARQHHKPPVLLGLKPLADFLLKRSVCAAKNLGQRRFILLQFLSKPTHLILQIDHVFDRYVPFSTSLAELFVQIIG